MSRWLGVLVLLVGCVDQYRLRDDPKWSAWDDVATFERVPVRVATWNIQELGQPDTVGFDAVVAVLRRLDADIVLLNEVVASEADALAALGAELGYPTVAQAEDQPFGDLGNAVLSRLPEVETTFPDGATLSGQAGTLDLTRRPVVHTVTIPGTDRELTVVGVHWKSGFEPDDLYRRAVDAYRTAQIADLASSSDYRLVLGDLNVEEADMPESPPVLVEAPAALSDSYRLGEDLQAIQDGAGLINDPYAILAGVGFLPVDLAQRDGELGTRPTSLRRIDRVLADGASQTAGLNGEVYNTRVEEPDFPGLADGTPKPDANDAARASDHLPVLVELRVRADE